MAAHYRFEVALQPESQAHDTARDQILDGRDSLRLVGVAKRWRAPQQC